MATVTDIGTFIESTPEIRDGRPCIAGTGVTVHRIAIWSLQGFNPEQIVEQIDHLDLAQVHAALTYYHANREQIDSEIEADSRTADMLYEQHGRKK
jgi:uncharacterized protein (DUF433 family)